ncbi:unnamed protein product, partial [marine sediment metagenome]
MHKSEAILAYTAGIMDGEGCIGLYKEKAAHYNLGYNLIVRVQIANTQEWLIRWLQMQFGGYITHQYDERGNRKPLWQWRIAARKAAEFLKLILPYLYLKRSQAEIAIQ